MNLTRYILRGLLLLLTALVLGYLNMKTDKNVGTIAEFQFKTLENIQNMQLDSLDTKIKLDLLTTEATRFSGHIIEDTAHVRDGVQFLIGVIGLFIGVELIFSILEKRKGRQIVKK